MSSRVKPSNAHVWGAPNGCPGQWKILEDLPPVEPHAAMLDGLAAHTILEEMLNGSGERPFEQYYEGRESKEGVLYTEEHYDSAKLASYYIESFKGDKFVEVPLQCIGGAPGKADAVVVSMDRKRIDIFEFKHGHKEVEEFENWQMLDYLWGVLRTPMVQPHSARFEKAVLHVVQPRAFHAEGPCRSWELTPQRAQAYLSGLEDRAKEALEDKPNVRPGSHCANCDGLPKCASGVSYAFKMFEVVSKPTCVDLTPESLGLLLSIAKQCSGILKELESAWHGELEHIVRSGREVPGWSMAEAKGHRKWNIEGPALEALGQGVGVELFDTKPVSPAEAMRRGVPQETVDALCVRPSSRKLKPTNRQLAKKVFS